MTLVLKYVSFYTIPLKEESFVKIEKHDNPEINEKDKNSNDSYQSFNNQEEKVKFYEWLAGIIDGDGCFLVSKKGYCSLEIVTQLRDKKNSIFNKTKFWWSCEISKWK